MKKKFFKVYYRCKANGRGSTFAVSDTISKQQAIRATHIQMDSKVRAGYYAPIAYSITEEEFNEHTSFSKDKPNVRW